MERVELMELVSGFDWSTVIDYGVVSVQVRAGKPYIVRVEETISVVTE